MNGQKKKRFRPYISVQNSYQTSFSRGFQNCIAFFDWTIISLRKIQNIDI